MKTPIVMLVGPAYSGKDTAAAVIAQSLGGVVVSLADPIKRFLADPEGFGLSDAQLWGSQKEDLFLRKQPSVGVMTQLAELHFGLADPDLVDELSSALEGWEGSLPKTTTARHMMQTLGTDCVRQQIDDDFWIDYGLDVANQLLARGGTYEKDSGVIEPDDDTLLTYPNVVVIPDGRFRNEALPVLSIGGMLLRVDRPDRPATGILANAAQMHASEAQQKTIPGWWFTGRLGNQGSLEDFQNVVRQWCHLVDGTATVAR